MGRSKATGPDATTGLPSPPMRHRAPLGTQNRTDAHRPACRGLRPATFCRDA